MEKEMWIARNELHSTKYSISIVTANYIHVVQIKLCGFLLPLARCQLAPLAESWKASSQLNKQIRCTVLYCVHSTPYGGGKHLNITQLCRL
jgi:hypothetical protein